jgi:hypothetical protein
VAGAKESLDSRSITVTAVAAVTMFQWVTSGYWTFTLRLLIDCVTPLMVTVIVTPVTRIYFVVVPFTVSVKLAVPVSTLCPNYPAALACCRRMDPLVKGVVLPFEFSLNTCTVVPKREWKATRKKLPLNLDDKAVDSILRGASSPPIP